MLGACGKKTEPQPNSVEPEAKSMEPIAENAASYKGSVFVIYEGKEYETKDIKVTFRKDNESTATISMYKVRFVPKMPVTVDLDLPGVNYQTKFIDVEKNVTLATLDYANEVNADLIVIMRMPNPKPIVLWTKLAQSARTSMRIPSAMFNGRV